jgi:phosphoadenosine phosphosulfate reductase
MLIENTLFGRIDKVAQAITRIKLHEPDDGYYVAFSGGKDSCVILDLVQRAGVKYDAHYNVTTVDPTELVQFIYQYHKHDVIFEKPEMPMWQLCGNNGIMPTRIARFCCAVYKEKGGNGRSIKVTGVRRAESVKRSKRNMLEPCNKHKKTQFLHPIIDWSTDDVWEYIKKYNVPYCKLYDQGWKRIGCVGCPFASVKQRRWELDQYPAIEKMWKKGCQAIIDKRKSTGKDCKFKTADEFYEWWLSWQPLPKDDNLTNIFGIMADESIT